MIKRIAISLVTTGLTALVFAAPASTAAHAAADRPQNGIPLENFNLYNEDYSGDCARIDASGLLIIGSGDCTKFLGDSNGLIYDETVGGSSPPCLYYNADKDAYDLHGCNASATSDHWLSTGATGWTQWYTVYNSQHGDQSMWADGTGTNNPLYAGAMNGSALNDHWQAVPAGSPPPSPRP